MQPTPLELLAPARNAEIARQAILHGADAVYIGGPSHGARAAATNSIEDIASLTSFAHLYGVKVYVTLNTLVYDSEISEVQKNIKNLRNAGVDALIVQDLGILEMDIPPIDLHASTQCDIRTPEKAKFLASIGFSQLVLPREFSLNQIREVRNVVPSDVKLEAFVHGALCVSYSGDCQASLLAKGRSANRGECAQMCRLSYDLTDEDGRVLLSDKHLLSLRDLCRINDIERLADAGISSFKIEGRLKDVAYVKNTTAAYRQAIDEIISKYPDKYCRSSYGKTTLSFSPDLEKTFNRGYTSYFIDGKPEKATKMANLDTPKWVGERVATVVRCDGKRIIIKPLKQLNNGDGLGYFDADGKYAGFHLNRVEANTLHTLAPLNIPRGTVLYRNRDTKYDTLMASDTAERIISVDTSLSISQDINSPTRSLSLTLTSENGVKATASIEVSPDTAKSPQRELRKRELRKMGDTPFAVSGYTDAVPDDMFIPASILSRLRRQATDALQRAIVDSYSRSERREESAEVLSYPSPSLSYHDNVANRLAGKLYLDHGASIAEKALEITPHPSDDEITVMTTRYCLRRELGCCLKEKEGQSLPKKLFISSGAVRYRLDFDCAKCQMHVIHTPKTNCEY